MGPNNNSYVMETYQNQDVAVMKNKGRMKPKLKGSQHCHRPWKITKQEGSKVHITWSSYYEN